MTTPPKARAYRINRDESVLAVGQGPQAADESRKVQVGVQKGAGPAVAAEPGEQLFESHEDGFGDMRFPGAAKPARPAGQGPAPADAAPMAERIAAVKAENLTDRQLRMARRIAAMHEIQAASDHEAVVLLRDRGIDPFHRASVSRILSEEGARVQAQDSGATALPARTDRRG
ncbi:capsule biosynthesis protein, partial [Paracoccus thiocyanatus]